jgi:hypothetical protein
MSRVPRRLLLWGGAAAIAAGGFAFMASNTVGTSSAGEGAGAVTGYAVSNISYTVDNTYYTTGHNAAYTAVTFKLTSLSATGSADGPPKDVNVYPEHSTGMRTWGHQTGNCTLSTPPGWVIALFGPHAGTGSGTYTCNFNPAVPAATLGKLDVEANQ